MRKNENVHALYNMLGYAEEPNICRRKLQLDYLGERDFNPKSCTPSQNRNIPAIKCVTTVRAGRRAQKLSTKM